MRSARCGWIAMAIGVIVLGVSAQRPGAQGPMDRHVMETADQVAPEQLPPPRRMTGIGNAHLPITATPTAQAWFDQGLNLLHDFWDYEAARAFQQGIRVDPQCAMCYWGLAEAEEFSHSTSRGYAAAAREKAAGLRARISDDEQRVLDASTTPYPQVRDLWRALVARHPDNTLFRVYLALALEDGFDAAGEPRPGQRESLAILEDVMRLDPSNSAATHYYVHALEASAHPERALHAAEVLAGLAPSSGHMVHMPGHIFFRVGDYVRAEQAFAASLVVDERYMREQQVQPDDDWNYVHDVMYAVANLMEEGKLADATAMSARLGHARGQYESTLYVYSTRDSISRLEPRLPVALRTADWPQVSRLIDVGTPGADYPNLAFLAQELRSFARGMEAVSAGDADAASAASASFNGELQRMSPAPGTVAPLRPPVMPSGRPQRPRMSDALLPPILSTLSIMSLELRASLAMARHDADDARTLFAEAARQETSLGYREPPIYIRPVAETEGDACLASGDWGGAIDAYTRALQQRPRSGFPLYGIALSQERAGEAAAAEAGYKDFLAAWKDADPNLPQVIHAREYLRR